MGAAQASLLKLNCLKPGEKVGYRVLDWIILAALFAVQSPFDYVVVIFPGRSQLQRVLAVRAGQDVEKVFLHIYGLLKVAAAAPAVSRTTIVVGKSTLPLCGQAPFEEVAEKFGEEEDQQAERQDEVGRREQG